MRATSLLLALCQLAAPASAILGRHDVAPEAYLVEEAELPAIGRLDERTETVLVADRWVLTAAHTVDVFSPFDEPYVRLGRDCYRVRTVVVHPEWEGGWQKVHELHDLALLELEREVTGIAPLPIYTGGDELGKEATLAGRGRAGNGRDGKAADADHRMRRGTNLIDAVTPTTLFMVFDEPDSATPLEAAAGAGDSGGPALVEVGGEPQVAGIGSATTGVPEVSLGLYGTTELYVRTSSFAPWIFNTVARRGGASEVAGTSGSPGTRVVVPAGEWSAPEACGPERWPIHPAASLAAGFFEAYREGSVEALQRFFESVGESPEDAAGRAERVFAGIVEGYGAAEVVSCTMLGEREIRVLVRPRDGSEWFAVGLRRGSDEPPRLERLYLKPQRPPGAPSRCQEEAGGGS